jgi:hypothetical protein
MMSAPSVDTLRRAEAAVKAGKWTDLAAIASELDQFARDLSGAELDRDTAQAYFDAAEALQHRLLCARKGIARAQRAMSAANLDVNCYASNGHALTVSTARTGRHVSEKS